MFEDILNHRKRVAENIAKSFGVDIEKAENVNIEKARSGVYKDTAENRKLGRVGQRYGSKKEEEKPTGDKTRKKSVINKTPETKKELKNLLKKIPVKNWNKIDTSKIKDMSGLFERYIGKFGDISNWDVSNVKDMSNMFSGSSFNGDISNWDVSNVKDMSNMFSYTAFDKDISNWDVSNVKNMERMFYNSYFDKDISNWDVSNVDSFSQMFMNSHIAQNFSEWNVKESASIRGMFEDSLMSSSNRVPWYDFEEDNRKK